jgi:hypothetical protein
MRSTKEEMKSAPFVFDFVAIPVPFNILRRQTYHQTTKYDQNDQSKMYAFLPNYEKPGSALKNQNL